MGAFILLVALMAPTAAQLPPMTADLEWKGRIVVEFKEELEPLQIYIESGCALLGNARLDALARRFGVYHMEKLIPWAEKPQNPEIRDISRYYILEFPVETDLHLVAQVYAADPGIITAEPYLIRKADYIPSDPYYSSQWAMMKVAAPQAWDFTLGSLSVIVGIVDSGTDTAHVDLRSNLWINPGEDLNHNGIVDPSERNGIDDDGNGFIDDFYGWNVWQGNNNVQDPPLSAGGGHGTHCAGDASAVIDNGIGIASLGGKAKIMTAKAGDGTYIMASAAGISYLAGSGADVISLSYGGTFYLAWEQNVINNAWAQGAIIMASAGNSATSQPHYPAAYSNVVAVASTNSSDQVSWFSNYGSWIDICAPGEGIMSTTPGNTYATWDGTSFSCPIAAGLACQVWAADPDLNNAGVLQQIYTTCVNIDSLNPGLEGLLGWGRIDAGAAISTLFPDLSYTEQTFDDAGGNGDGRPDPGETVDLLLTVLNSSMTVNATGVQIALSCSDPDINILQGVCTLGNIPMGASSNNHADPITFLVNAAAAPHEVTFTLTLTDAGTGLTLVDNLVQMIGRPAILLVDDDNGLSYQQWYEMDLDSLNQVHDLWEVSTQGEIPLAEIQLYSHAIWHTSNVTNPLTPAEQTVIEFYLSSGGHLFLTGQDIDEQLAGTSFYANVLHCTSHATVGTPQLDGVAGDPISNGTSLLLLGAGGAGNSTSPATIDPTTGAQLVYTYATSGLGGAIRWESGNTRLAYFAFCFEAASGIGTTTSRQVVMQNVLNWFGQTPPPPPISVTLTPIGAPIVIPAGGGSFDYIIAVANSAVSPQTFDGWIMVTLPNGSPYGPVLGPVTLTLPAGASLDRNRTQSVPGSAPSGLYTYIAYVGSYPDSVWDEDNFTFEKAATGAGPLIGAWSNTGEEFGEVIGVRGTEIPTEFLLLGNCPNPFNPSTAIRFELPEASQVELEVFDARGSTIWPHDHAALQMQAGVHEIRFDGSDLASGVYVYRITAGAWTACGKMILMK